MGNVTLNYGVILSISEGSCANDGSKILHFVQYDIKFSPSAGAALAAWISPIP